MRVLVVNAGSSSLKLRILDGDDELVWNRDLPAGESVPRDLPAVDAVGHRVVHGGPDFTGPTLLDGPVRQQLAELTGLAPLHQPASLQAISQVSALLPGVPAVACFDTAFHARLPPAAATYPLPARWRDAYSIRRYGFHGLSHAYASTRVAQLLGRPVEALRTVTCHLGSGASLAAVAAGRSLDTTMGFTPLEGLMMATRSGTIDPGLLLWLQQQHGISADEMTETLERQSGLLGLAGDANMQAVLERNDESARLAIDVYVHRLRAAIAAMTGALGGLDTLVFTGGIGENSPRLRAAACEELGWLGIGLDRGRNDDARHDADISAAAAPVRTVVVYAREDLEIARQVRTLLTRPPSQADRAR